MKILLVPDSFKGTISSERAIELLKQAVTTHFPESQAMGIPIGDGGEGTMKALITAKGGNYASCTVTGPLGEPVTAVYGILDDDTVVLETAQASGLPLIDSSRLDPVHATSFGSGELLREVLKKGYRNIYLTIGGSATNDGGVGAATALGIRFLKKNGEMVPPDASELSEIAEIDVSGLMPELKEAQIKIMCDVSNPLLGPTGATHIYGKQKGVTEELEGSIEKGMEHFADIVEQTCGFPIRNIPGSGAAGGFAVPLLAFAKCSLCSGIETVLQILDFDRLLEGVDLVISGEGRLDGQSSQGKVLDGIGEACKKKNIPVVALVGGIGDGASQIYDCGVRSAMSSVNNIMTAQEAFSRAEELFLDAADRMCRFIKVGMELKKEG